MGHRILLDENVMRRSLVLPLRPRLDALETMQSLGRRRLPDADQLEFAAAEGWTIFTFDTGDFARLHWEWTAAERSHAGIVLETDSLLPVGELLGRLMRLLQDYESRPLANQLVYLGDYR